MPTESRAPVGLAFVSYEIIPHCIYCFINLGFRQSRLIKQNIYSSRLNVLINIGTRRYFTHLVVR